MSNIWISSDTHYFDSDMLSYKNSEGVKVREFSSVHEMDETMIERHNSVVKPGDIWYHLGDVFHDKKKHENRVKFEILWSRLNGKKRLIIGNHDDIRFLSGKNSDGEWYFDKVMMWRKFPEFGMILTHVPIHETGLYSSTDFSKQLLNVCGHIHRSPAPTRMHYNVCVEQTNYSPVNIEDLSKIAKERQSELFT